MATNRSSRVYYKSLHHLSSCVMYDTGKTARGKCYAVERVIEKRRLQRVRILSNSLCANEIKNDDQLMIIKNMLYNFTIIIRWAIYLQNDFKYPVKWVGWPLHWCSWEPSDHLTADLLR